MSRLSLFPGVMILRIETPKINIYLPNIVGKGYGTFWRFKGRYRVVKGSRASKKSKTTALWFIVNMMHYPFDEDGNPTGLLPNLLVVRKTFRTLKDSCFTELKWAVHRLKVDAWWEFKESPLEATYTPTGQKIYFRGLDDPLKVTSITVDVGVLCWAWLEEAYEVTKEDDFNILDESIRGEVSKGLFKQWTITFNPWNERHWLKKRFFDAPPDPDLLAMTTNYMCNEWLDDADIKVFEDMKNAIHGAMLLQGLAAGALWMALYMRTGKKNGSTSMKYEASRVLFLLSALTSAIQTIHQRFSAVCLTRRRSVYLCSMKCTKKVCRISE